METIRSLAIPEQRSGEPLSSEPKYSIKFDNDLLKRYEQKISLKNRRERVLPPIKHWTTTLMLSII